MQPWGREGPQHPAWGPEGGHVGAEHWECFWGWAHPAGDRGGPERRPVASTKRERPRRGGAGAQLALSLRNEPSDAKMHTRWLKEPTSISHSSRSWQVHNQSASSFKVWWGPFFSLIAGCFLNVSSSGRKRWESSLGPLLSGHWSHHGSTTVTAYVVIQSLSCVWLFVTPWTAAHQAPLSFMSISWSLLTFSWSSLKFSSLDAIWPSNLPQKAPPLNNITLALGFQHMYCEEYKYSGHNNSKCWLD